MREFDEQSFDILMSVISNRIKGQLRDKGDYYKVKIDLTSNVDTHKVDIKVIPMTDIENCEIQVTLEDELSNLRSFKASGVCSCCDYHSGCGTIEDMPCALGLDEEEYKILKKAEVEE